MRTIWIISTCVLMSNFLKAAQGSEPVSSHSPPASEGSSYSVCPDSVFIPCNLLEDDPWDMSDPTKQPRSVDSICRATSLSSPTLLRYSTAREVAVLFVCVVPYNRTHRLQRLEHIA